MKHFFITYINRNLNVVTGVYQGTGKLYAKRALKEKHGEVAILSILEDRYNEATV